MRAPIAAVESRALAAMGALRPLTLGRLYVAALQPDPDILASEDLLQPLEQGRLPRGGTLARVAERHGVTTFQVALAWVVRDGTVLAIP